MHIREYSKFDFRPTTSMRILQTIASVNPTGGGPVESLKQIGKELIKQGHEMEVASLDDPEAAFLESFPFPIHPLGPGKTFYSYSDKFVTWLKANASRFDIVVIRGIWRFNSFGTWLALRQSTTPYVVFTHGMLDPWFQQEYPLKHLKKSLVWPFTDYRVLRDAKATLFTSIDEREGSRNAFYPYTCNEVLVPYGIPGPPEQDNGTQELFSKFPTLKGKRLITFLGRIHRKKGCDLLISAFISELKECDEIRLVIAGPDQEGLQPAFTAQLAAAGMTERVVWTGLLENDLKWELLRASEVFVLPSHQENFGISVAEALACSTPVLISNKVNIWREVKEFNAGLVEPDTLEGTSSLLNKWFALEESKRLAMGQKALECFSQNFSKEVASRGLLESLSPYVSG